MVSWKSGEPFPIPSNPVEQNFIDLLNQIPSFYPDDIVQKVELKDGKYIVTWKGLTKHGVVLTNWSHSFDGTPVQYIRVK